MSDLPRPRAPLLKTMVLLATLTSGAACSSGGAGTGDPGGWGTGSNPATARTDGGASGTATDGTPTDGTGGSGAGDAATTGSGGSRTYADTIEATGGSSADASASDGSGDSGTGGKSTGGTGGSGTGGSGGSGTGGSGSGGSGTGGTGGSGTGGSTDGRPPDNLPVDLPGLPDVVVPDVVVPDAVVPNAGVCAIPAAAQAADSTHPTTVIGQGTPASCTGDAFVAAVAKGGVITFDCGPAPVTIALDQTAKVFNNKTPEIVIDGGGKVTLSGRNARRILYQNTCDPAQIYTTPRCDNQDHPRLTVQNLTFIDGNAKGEKFRGGGAIYAQGGRLKLVNTRFFHNVCDSEGPDVGGGAVRAFQQFDGQPLYVVGSTFGGPGELGNEGANGGALSAIGVSYSIINSVFEGNRAIGEGGNPAVPGTPGGGSGGAIYNDGNTFTLSLCGTRIQNNRGRQFGGAIFFVSNDRSGSLTIRDSLLRGNLSEDRVADQFPGIFVLARTRPDFINSTVE